MRAAYMSIMRGAKAHISSGGIGVSILFLLCSVYFSCTSLIFFETVIFNKSRIIYKPEASTFILHVITKV